MAAIPIDILMNFYTFCIALGEEPFQQKEEVVSTETGRKAIETMKELYGVVDRRLFNFNPIAVAEWMSSSNDIWYCPFAYGYSNYSRTGYAKHLLHYTDVVRFNGSPLRTTVGGTGLSVSAFSQHKEAALDLHNGLYRRFASKPYMCNMEDNPVICSPGRTRWPIT